jgi:hypothetical protein
MLLAVTKTSLSVLLAGGLLGSAACGGPQPPPFKPIVDNRILMQSVVDPQAYIVWNSVKTVVTDSTEEVRPTSEEEWEMVRNAAIVVAESGNLLMMVPRARDGGDWMTFSQAMVDKATELMHAAESRDADKIFTLGGDLYETCTTCHQKYVEAIANANK